jgi:hypothetical protein
VVAATRISPTWERYAWVAGVLYVLAVVAESAVGLAVGINQNDSAAKVATELADHRTRLVVVEGLCVVYAVMFPIYLWKLYDRLLRTDADGSRALGTLMLVGGVLFVALHAVSDVGIYGVLDGKLASFGAQHDHSVTIGSVPLLSGLVLLAISWTGRRRWLRSQLRTSVVALRHTSGSRGDPE